MTALRAKLHEWRRRRTERRAAHIEASVAPGVRVWRNVGWASKENPSRPEGGGPTNH